MTLQIGANYEDIFSYCDMGDNSCGFYDTFPPKHDENLC